jgi:4-amino-4-deoxy-L-arabinose transferase-like glycosyltransferase
MDFGDRRARTFVSSQGAQAIEEQGGRAVVLRTFTIPLARRDALNIFLLLAAFVLVILIVPPVRSFPINDDWAYAHSVSDILRLDYVRPPWVQATALTHVGWGALVSLVLGEGYTSLTIANLIVSALCLVLFYALLRRLNVSEGVALFGAALLGAHPVFFNISFTFMTDNTFMLFVLLACLLFVFAVQIQSEILLLLGGIAVALAYLTRQLGAVILLVEVMYLWSLRRLTWRQFVLVGAVPALTAVLLMFWEGGQPRAPIDLVMQEDLQTRIAQPATWAFVRLIASAVALTICGAFLLPLFGRPVNYIRALGLTILLGASVLPYLVTRGAILGFSGNVIDSTGFAMCCAPGEHMWDWLAWAALVLVGAVSMGFLLARATEPLSLPGNEWRGILARRDPVTIVYGSMGLLSLAVFVLPVAVFDRYLLPLVAALILFVCRSLSFRAVGNRELGIRWLLLVPVLLFSIAAQHDSLAKRESYWSVAQGLVGDGVVPNKIGMSYEWGGEYLFDQEGQKIRESGDFSDVQFMPAYLFDPEYYISEVPMEGYDVVQARSYTSWLKLGQTSTVLVQRRR